MEAKWKPLNTEISESELKSVKLNSMDTAPKDGTWFNIYRKREDTIYKVSVVWAENCHCFYDGKGYSYNNILGWSND